MQRLAHTSAFPSIGRRPSNAKLAVDKERLHELKTEELIELLQEYMANNTALRDENLDLHTLRDALMRDQDVIIKENERLLRKLEQINRYSQVVQHRLRPAAHRERHGTTAARGRSLGGWGGTQGWERLWVTHSQPDCSNEPLGWCIGVLGRLNFNRYMASNEPLAIYHISALHEAATEMMTVTCHRLSCCGRD